MGGAQIRCLDTIISSYLARLPMPCSPKELCRLKIPYQPQRKNRYLHFDLVVSYCSSCRSGPVSVICCLVWLPWILRAILLACTISWLAIFLSSTTISYSSYSFSILICKITLLVGIFPCLRTLSFDDCSRYPI